MPTVGFDPTVVGQIAIVVYQATCYDYLAVIFIFFPIQMHTLLNGQIYACLDIRVTVNLTKTHKRTAYTIQICNRISTSQIMIDKHYSDFDILRKMVCHALDYGHLCEAQCPWFWMHIQHSMPRKMYFNAKSEKVIQSRAKQFERMLVSIIAFITSPASSSCSRAMRKIPDALTQFLFQDIGVEVAMSCMPPKTKLQSPNLALDLQCTICQHALSSAHFRRSSLVILDIEDKQQYSITTLSCGHVFHDECILHALNNHLICPTCSAQM